MTHRRSMPARRRLRIFEAHKGICCLCNEKIDGIRETWTIEHMHALGLFGKDEDENCGPAHERCRRAKDKGDISQIRKADRQKARHLGAKAKKGRPMLGTKASGWKKKMSGKAVKR